MQKSKIKYVNRGRDWGHKREMAVASLSDKQNKLKNNCSCCSFINVVPQKASTGCYPPENPPIALHIVHNI